MALTLPGLGVRIPPNGTCPTFSVLSSVPGLIGVAKPPSTHLSSSSSTLPGICKELIGQTMATLRGCVGTEESMADQLIQDLQLVYTVVRTVSDLYDGLDDDSQENGGGLGFSTDFKCIKTTPTNFETEGQNVCYYRRIQHVLH